MFEQNQTQVTIMFKTTSRHKKLPILKQNNDFKKLCDWLNKL